jgi:hypothetical protein
MGALIESIGGTDYERFTADTLKLIVALQLKYFEGTIFKYVSRASLPGGYDDLQRALSWTTLALSLSLSNNYDSMARGEKDKLLKYCLDNSLSSKIYEILAYIRVGNFKIAKTLIEQYLAQMKFQGISSPQNTKHKNYCKMLRNNIAVKINLILTKINKISSK